MTRSSLHDAGDPSEDLPLRPSPFVTAFCAEQGFPMEASPSRGDTANADAQVPPPGDPCEKAPEERAAVVNREVPIALAAFLVCYNFLPRPPPCSWTSPDLTPVPSPIYLPFLSPMPAFPVRSQSRYPSVSIPYASITSSHSPTFSALPRLSLPRFLPLLTLAFSLRLHLLRAFPQQPPCHLSHPLPSPLFFRPLPMPSRCLPPCFPSPPVLHRPAHVPLPSCI
jgi:hypothetical protein